MTDGLTEFDKILLEILDRIIVEDSSENWTNAKFLKQRMTQNDKRGSIGWRFLAETLLKLYPRRIFFNDY